jgi:hypothetical protein
VTRQDRRLIAASRLVENLAYKLPVARDHLRYQIALNDGRTTTASGSDTADRTISVLITDDNGEPILNEHGEEQYDQVPVTIVEAAMVHRDHLINVLADLDAHAKALATIAANALRDCDRIIGNVTPLEKPKRCDATGLDGYLLPWPGEGWSDLNCQDAPTRGQLCARCYQRHRRWRHERSMPPLGADIPPAHPDELGIDGCYHAAGM